MEDNVEWNDQIVYMISEIKLLFWNVMNISIVIEYVYVNKHE